MAGFRLRVSPFFRKLLLALIVALIAVYLAFGAFLWRTMHKPPEEFGRVMAKMPGPFVFLLFPFETMWVHARTGNLNLGDPAPDFSLMKVDKSGYVRLTDLNKRQPVVLVFGSYT